jgi:hypothetical protein
MNPLRRLVISSAALAPLGCATATFDRALPVATPKLIPGVRKPQIGQQWTYLKINPFTSKVTDVITERLRYREVTKMVELWQVRYRGPGVASFLILIGVEPLIFHPRSLFGLNKCKPIGASK